MSENAMGVCPRWGKPMYHDRNAALAKIRLTRRTWVKNRRPVLTTYRCPDCQAWHLTGTNDPAYTGKGKRKRGR